MKVEVADTESLQANDQASVLQVTQFRGQAIDVQKIGGQADTDVIIQVKGVNGAESLTNTFNVDASALHTFGNPTTAGPLATSRLEWTVLNNSPSNTYTGSNAYKTHINYILKNMSVAEKMQRGFPLNSDEQALAQKYGLDNLLNEGLPIVVPDYVKPTLSQKEVVEDREVAKTFDISATGRSKAVNVASQTGIEKRNIVVYVTGLEINSENYTISDGVTVEFVRNSSDSFYDLNTAGLPGQSNNYKVDLFIPFTGQMDVNVFSSSTVNNVDVKLKYSIVRRSMVEKALYNLSSEVTKSSLFNDVRDRIEAGVSLQGILSG